jgi:hypothetical protein
VTRLVVLCLSVYTYLSAKWCKSLLNIEQKIGFSRQKNSPISTYKSNFIRIYNYQDSKIKF